MDPDLLFHSESEPAPKPVRFAVWPAFCFLVSMGLGCLALCLLLNSLSRPSKSPIFDLRLDHLSRHIDDYDMIFIGNSRVFQSIHPPSMDAAFKDIGLPVRTFNLAAQNMTLLEARSVIDYLIELAPKRLKVIAIEPTLAESPGTNWSHARAVAVHDFRNTKAMLAYYWSAQTPLTSTTSKLRDSLIHVASSLFHHVNVGRLTHEMMPKLPQGRAKDEWASLVTEGGFKGLPDKKNDGLINAFTEWRTEVEWKDAVKPLPMGRARADWYQDLANRIRKVPAEPVLLLSPSWNALPEHQLLIEPSSGFNAWLKIDGRNKSYAGVVYEPSYWADPGHFNETGAKWYSRWLVSQMSLEVLDRLRDASRE